MNTEFAELIDKWPDFIITFLGVLAGGLVAFWIAKWQIAKQDAETIEREKKLLSKLFSRVKIELRNNKNRVTQLQKALENSKKIRVDILEWAITIINSFSSNAYVTLTNSGLQRNLPINVESMRIPLKVATKNAHGSHPPYFLIGAKRRCFVFLVIF